MIMVDYTKDIKYKNGKEITSFINSELFPIELILETTTNSNTTTSVDTTINDRVNFPKNSFWRVVGSENGSAVVGISPLQNITDADVANGRMKSKFDLEFNRDINFHHVTGGNTYYISHPEEIMADNVATLAMCLGGYDMDEIDEHGTTILEKIASVFGKEVHNRFLSAKVKKNRPVLSERQKNACAKKVLILVADNVRK